MRQRYFLLLAPFVLAMLLHCKTTQKSAGEIGMHPLELAPLERQHYEILGNTEATAERMRIFWFEFGDTGKGTIKGRQDNVEYKALKIIMCISTYSIVCHNYPLDARDQAVYIALKKVERADAVLQPQFRREEVNFLFYQKVTDTVSAKAIRYLSDDEIKNIKTTGKARVEDEDDEK